MDQSLHQNSLALFDFDGTITRKDSLLEFIRYYHGSWKFMIGFLLNVPILILFKIKVIPNWKAKEILMTFFFNGIKLNDFNKIARSYSLDQIPEIVKPEMLGYIEEHKKMNNDIVVVSASFENWLQPWATKKGIGLLATKLEIHSGRLSGKIDGHNCYGPEKEVRIRQELILDKYDNIYAYGDSRGDEEMLRLANYCYYRGKMKNI